MTETETEYNVKWRRTGSIVDLKNVTDNVKDYVAGFAIAILQKRDSYNKSKGNK